MNLEAARTTHAEAQVALAAADHELDELRTRLDGLTADLANEKATLKGLEADAIEARASGRSFKIASLDNARGSIRITEGAIAAVESQLEAARAKRGDLHTAATAAERAVASIHAGALLLEMAPIASEILRRIDAADPRGHLGLVKLFADVVGAAAPGKADTVQHRLGSKAFDIMLGTAPDNRRAAEPLLARLALPDDVAAVLPVPGEPKLIDMLATPGPKAVRLVA